MPRTRRKRGTIAIDTVPMPDKPAQLLKVRDRYVLKLADKRIEVPVSLVTPEADLKKLVGRNVNVVFSRKRPDIIIGILPKKRPPIVCVLCYIGTPDWQRRIQPEVRDILVRQLLREGEIDQKLGRILRARG